MTPSSALSLEIQVVAIQLQYPIHTTARKMPSQAFTTSLIRNNNMGKNAKCRRGAEHCLRRTRALRFMPSHSDFEKDLRVDEARLGATRIAIDGDLPFRPLKAYIRQHLRSTCSSWYQAEDVAWLARGRQHGRNTFKKINIGYLHCAATNQWNTSHPPLCLLCTQSLCKWPAAICPSGNWRCDGPFF